MKNKVLTLLVSVLFFLGGLGISFAKSSCQGLSMSRCKSSSSCTWVKSFRRKGSRVKAYCRAKPAKGVRKSSLKKKRKSRKSSSIKRRVKRKTSSHKKKRTKRKTRRKTKIK